MDVVLLSHSGSYRHFEISTTMHPNATMTTETEVKLVKTISPVLSAEVYEALIMFLTYTSLFCTIVGIFSNALVITVYTKIGFSDTVNISYLALGISDLSLSTIRFWGAVCYTFVVTKTNVPFDPLGITVTTSFFPGQGFEKATAFITAFIALERCLCVQFPLHVKRIVTTKKTVTSIVIIFLCAFTPSNFIHMVFPLKWEFNPAQNKSILVVVPLQTPLRYIIQRALLAYYGTVLHFTALIAVWIFTIFLAVGLKKTAEIRKDNFKQSNNKGNKQKERRIIKTVFLLAVTYLICSIPTAVTLLVPHFEPEFETSRGLARISRFSHVLSALMTVINSNANLFIFIYMGSKFRETLGRLFCKKYP
ncbi:multitransmembrane protein [Plakobranchus ocellatus]|uniref:Multitransmembrane protein n=1 Tax=Plakobranchus ocellatus TaxID=259542 RepID=A0AAV4DZY0_9GAST|nr:multitransmembrane protein [Plakobranchus ocellatus]